VFLDGRSLQSAFGLVARVSHSFCAPRSRPAVGRFYETAGNVNGLLPFLFYFLGAFVVAFVSGGFISGFYPHSELANSVHIGVRY
jgi:hypothetical protein